MVYYRDVGGNPMKTPVSIFLFFAIFAVPALAEFTQQEILQIRLILKEEIEALEQRIANP